MGACARVLRPYARGDGARFVHRGLPLVCVSIPFARVPRMRTTPRSLVRQPEKGAAGKAFLVWLLSGSGILAIVAFIVFKVAGC
jgi:hypothetical protein